MIARWCYRSLSLSVSGTDRSENPFLFFLLLWFNSKPLHIWGLKQNTGAERNFIPRLFLLPEVCSGFFVLQFFMRRVVKNLKTISILGVHLASPSPNKWGIVSASKQKAKNIFERSQKKFRTQIKLNYYYQNTKNAVLGGISISKHWIRVLTIRALLQPECNGIRISKHWICTDRFTCCDHFAMARVLTSNGYEYSHPCFVTT